MRAALLAILAASTSLAASCDRSCLKATLDQYLKALIAHQPASAPLSLGFRQTENAKVQRTGTGLWETAKGLGKVTRYFYDPVTEQAAFFGLIDEAPGPAIATLRLRVEDRKITEAEWVLSRKGDPGLGAGGGNQAVNAYYDADYLIAHQPSSIIPKEGHVGRADLIAITNSYFDGLSAHDGKLIIAHPGCTRLENGVLTTQRAIQGSTQVTDCTSEGAMANIYAVTARRYLVDEDAQTVLGLVLFQRKPGVALRRNLLSEFFYVESGPDHTAKIKTIYASMYYPDADAMAPNWPPFDGNWPPPIPAK